MTRLLSMHALLAFACAMVSPTLAAAQQPATRDTVLDTRLLPQEIEREVTEAFNSPSTVRATGGETVRARLPDTQGRKYPYAEAVLLDATLIGIAPEGWGPIDGDAAHVRFLEFNSRVADGKPVDVGKRHPASRQLDAATSARYRDPAWVLGGWAPHSP